MLEKCSTKDKFEKNEKKRLGAVCPAFWFTSLIVWIFVIKQIMHFSIIISFLYTSASMTRTQGSPIPPTANPSSTNHIPKLTQHSVNAFPQFLSVHQLVEVSEGSTAQLDCKLGNLGLHHTVSWMRSSDMSVLTVGGFVFSSDPRIGVVAPSRPGQAFGSWTLQIQSVTQRDAGEYQCQVNSEPKESLDVTLIIEGDEEGSYISGGEKEIYSVFKNTKKYQTQKSDFQITNISKSDERLNTKNEETQSEIKTAKDSDINSITKQVQSANDKIPQRTIESQEQVDKMKTSPIKIRKHESVDSPKVSVTGVNENEIQKIPDTIRKEVPEATTTYQDKQLPVSTAIVKSKEVNEGESNLTKQKATLAAPTASDAAVKDNTENNTSLLVPILSLSVVVLLILVLGSVTGFYGRYVKTKQAKQHRSRSTTRTMDSRRSSGSRSSDDSMYSNKRMRRMVREMEIEKERMMIYDEIKHKTRLSPLIEVIEPTPPLQRNSPIFMMTSLDMLGISDESEYEADISDVTCNTKKSEEENYRQADSNYRDADNTGQSFKSSEQLMEDEIKIPNKYEILRSKIQSYLGDHGLLDEQAGEEDNNARRPKTKLVDNINTFM